MKIIITGGGGFIGNQLARKIDLQDSITLAPDHTPICVDQIIISDIQISEAARSGFSNKVHFSEGDISNPSYVEELIDSENIILFHLAAIVSGHAEQDFDLGMKVNLDGTSLLLEACRKLDSCPRVIFASSLAVFGGPNMEAVVSDKSKRDPQTTYGMTKLIGELMVNDYTRKGFIDGRAARLPTIFIRPGKPNAAASSFASGLFREPLNGQPCELPVPRDQAVPLLGYRRVVDCFYRLMELDSQAIGADRIFTLPSRQYQVSDMIETLQRVASEKGLTLGTITHKPDPVIVKIVQGWPIGTDATRAEKLGMKADASVEQVILDFLEDFPPS